MKGERRRTDCRRRERNAIQKKKAFRLDFAFQEPRFIRGPGVFGGESGRFFEETSGPGGSQAQ